MDDNEFKTSEASSNNVGLLIASGLITGEALIGILLAIPAAAEQGDFFTVLANPLDSFWGLLVVFLICFWLYRMSTKAFHQTE